MTEKFFHKPKDSQDKPLVLIAGGAGFIGSFLCELLLQQNCRVICLDNLTTGTKKNLKNCLTSPDFLLVRQDLGQPLNAKVGEPDYIFHLAGLEAYISGDDVSLETLLANVSGTINLLKLAKKTGAKFLLGSSPQVFQARVSTQKLKEYFGKGAVAEMASFAEAKRSAEALTTEFMEREKIDARIVRLNWIYGPRMNLRTGGILVRMIKQATDGGPLTIPGDGSQKIQPTFVSDVVYGLTKAMFSSGTAGKIYSLINPQEETLLSVAHRLQGLVGQGLKIEHVAKEELPVFESGRELISQEHLDWQPKVGLDEGLKQTLVYFQKRIKRPIKGKPEISKEETREKTKVEKRKEPSFIGQKKLIIGLTLAFLLALLYLPGALALNSFLGIRNLHSAYRSAVAGNFSKTVKSAKLSEGDFTRAQGNLQSLSSVFNLFGQDQLQSKTETYLTIGLQASRGMEKLGGVAEKASQISQAIFQDQLADIEQLTSEMSTDLDSVYQQFSYLEGQLKSKPDARQFLTRFDSLLVENLTTVREMLLEAKAGVLLLPDLAGVHGKRTYLILFQNNMELRPTGGFIGSFALATFDGGKLIDFQLLDVYSADGQLKGHVDPPEPIRRYLGEAGWYLRDSNFNPDFLVSALQASWFLEKELGRKVDGVVGVDLFLAQRILQAVGPVELFDYQEKIDADSLFERAEYYAEVNFFPGSTQKKDFLGAIANALLVEVRQVDEEKWLALGQALYQSLKSKDLLIALNNPEAARILAALGWDGSLRRVKCLPAVAGNQGEAEKGECLVDYLMIVESNFGVNKANYFVKRNLTHQVNFNSEGRVKETLKIDYHNQSQSEIFPAGRYKNYLRILTPKGTRLEKAMIDGKEIEKEKIDETEISERTAFGFLVEVPIQAKKTVEISYRLADRLAIGPGNRYLLYLQKQPGIEDEMFNLWLVPPAKAQVVSTQPESSFTSGLVVFAPQFDQDLVFEVSF